MSNPQDWMVKLPEVIYKDDILPGETQEEYFQRTGKSFFVDVQDKCPDELMPMMRYNQTISTSNDPSIYYNGTEALDKMVLHFGLQETILWCRMTAYKYSLRIGKKAGNSVEQEAGKISWYLEAAERLSKSHDTQASV